MNKTLAALIGFGVLLFGSVLFFQFANVGTAALWQLSDEGKWLLPLVAVAALIDSINPCAFSILILTIAFLFSLGKLRSSILAIGSAYILGIFLVYMLIGLGILQVLHIFDTPHFMAQVGAYLLILLGLINITNEFFPAFPVKLKIPQAAHHKIATLMEKGSLPSAFLLGGLVGICEFPCTGGPYLMVLGLLHDQTTFTVGLGYLVLYNLIFILPLVIILRISGDKAIVEKVQKWKARETRTMRFGGGIAMVLLGLVILSL
ncbi:MAG: cytochrome c biogenesis protein CcdA [Burkholderiales bacterium]|nr:cytochrome c biogenesis protein CcdA [Burkholderiales bacterium]